MFSGSRLDKTIRGIIIPHLPTTHIHTHTHTRPLIAHRSIRLPQVKALYLALGNLADDLRRPARHDGEARHNHIRRDDGAVQDPHEVLDDGELADHHVAADANVAPHERCLDHRTGSDEHVVCDLERVV